MTKKARIEYFIDLFDWQTYNDTIVLKMQFVLVSKVY